MNGADELLQNLEERLAQMAVQFQRAELALDPKRIGGALEELSAVRRELRELMGRVIDLRTLAQPTNWRLRMQYDPPLYCEFLKGSDEQMLMLALRECGDPVIEKVLSAIERARHPSPDQDAA